MSGIPGTYRSRRDASADRIRGKIPSHQRPGTHDASACDSGWPDNDGGKSYEVVSFQHHLPGSQAASPVHRVMRIVEAMVATDNRNPARYQHLFAYLQVGFQVEITSDGNVAPDRQLIGWQQDSFGADADVLPHAQASAQDQPPSGHTEPANDRANATSEPTPEPRPGPTGIALSRAH